MIDGISGLKLAQDGTVRYNPIDGGTYPWDTYASYVSNMRGYELELYHNSMVERGYSAHNANGLHREVYHISGPTDHTLAGGAAANASFVPDSTGEKIGAVWVQLSWDTDPAAAYRVQFHTEDSATVLWELAWTPTEIGERKWLMIDTDTVTKDLFGDITGGAGAEVVYSLTNYCYF